MVGAKRPPPENMAGAQRKGNRAAIGSPIHQPGSQWLFDARDAQQLINE